MVREFRMDMHTLLCFKWITDEDLIVGIVVLHLLYITGNCPVLCGSLDERGFGGKWRHTYGNVPSLST